MFTLIVNRIYLNHVPLQSTIQEKNLICYHGILLYFQLNLKLTRIAYYKQFLRNRQKIVTPRLSG